MVSRRAGERSKRIPADSLPITSVIRFWFFRACCRVVLAVDKKVRREPYEPFMAHLANATLGCDCDGFHWYCSRNTLFFPNPKKRLAGFAKNHPYSQVR